MQREGAEYTFPMPITPYMRDRYRQPLVFKWEIYRRKPGDLKKAYIGEAQELCPKRLYSFLNPGKSQIAQQKINSEFRGYLKDKLNVGLFFCDVKSLKFDGDILDTDRFSSKWLRRLVVSALVLIDQKAGYTILDL
jgi:hypothetical protein